MSISLKRSLILLLALATVAWSTLFFAIQPASAAGCTSGTLIKGSLPAVYYCGADGKRYVFTNDKAYWTWYPDFSGVMVISDADLATVQIGGNVTYRPGVKMLKIQSDPKVYAVSKNGTLRPITDEAAAASLYGANWNQQIDDVSDAFFTNYTVGSAISGPSDYDKNAEMSASQTINQDKGLTTGGVSIGGGVSKASDSPLGATLPLGATGVSFLKFHVSNSGSSSMTVDQITVLRSGPGATSDISSVYLYEGNERLTTGRSINSSTNEATFTGLGLVLGAGTTRTLWVAVDVATGGSAGNVHAMSVTSVMSSGNNLAGTPVTGANFTLAGATVGSLTIAKTGSITNPKLGESEAKVAEFTIAAGSSEDVRLERLTLFQGGNLAGANLSNLKLKQAGLTIATATGFNSKLRATFTLSSPGMLLEKGATKTFQVYADIGGTARSGDTLKIYVEESSDLHGVGQTFGYGTTVVRTAYDGDSCTSSAGDCSFSTVEAGQVTINFIGPTSMDVQTNKDEVELFRFSIIAQSNVEVRNLRTNIAASASAAGASGLLTTGNVAQVTDIKVTNVANNSAWWGPKDVTGTDGTAADNDLEQDLVFTDVQTLTAGQVYTFAVTADIASTATGGETLTFRLDAFTDSDLRNLDNSTFLTVSSDVVPSGALTGNPQTMRAAYLGVGLNGLALSNSYVKGSSNVPMFSVSFGSEDGTITKLTSLKITGFIDADGASDFVKGQDTDGAETTSVADTITSCYLYDVGGGKVRGETKSPGSGTDGTMTFSGLDWDIDSIGASAIMYCHISNSAFRNGDSERIAFKIVAGGDGTVQDLDGNSVSFLGAFPINDTPSAIMTVLDSGTMSYSLAPSDTESEAGLVIAGQSGVTLAKIRLTAANEELKQTKMRWTLSTAANYTNVVSMSLYDGATLIAGPVPVNSSGHADFSGFEFVVPKNGSKTLTVKAQLNTISGGATSGADLKITTDLSTPATGTFEYRGTNSSTVVSTIASTDVTGATKILRKTKPTVSLAGLPTTTLTDGTKTLARITITADSAEQVSLKTILWTVTKSHALTGVAVSTGSSVREVGQGANIAGTATAHANCATTVGTGCPVTSTFGSEQVIAAGTSKTYELVMTVSSSASTHSLSTIISADSDAVTDDLASGGTMVGASLYAFIWSDNSAIPHDDADGGSDDWTNGRFVKVFPTDAQTLSAL